MKKLELRIVADLPEDEMERAEVLVRLKPLIAALVEGAVQVIPVKHEMKVFSAKVGKSAAEGSVSRRRSQAAE